ncbi:hypothetical protein BGZ96_008259 [Linnemannia gamsii]|uniref:RBR-type E3 ubiquitin transferase n=1 Tax=Linnemannia gamsii TaxID=64522 RepID=A0ABQ7JZE5_9FUNG|nr:hypothetical protein BGZ96_008259 [Linnemannia gamsii]
MQQVDEYEEDYDYVFLSDFENDASCAESTGVVRNGSSGASAKGKKQVSTGGSHTVHNSIHVQTQGLAQGSGASSFQQRQRTPESQRSDPESDQDDYENDGVSVSRRCHRSSKATQGGEEHHDELDGSDGEEIEYEYETDLLVIMPAMLRNYSHHATNYHPELWHGSPGSGRSHAGSGGIAKEYDTIDNVRDLFRIPGSDDAASTSTAAQGTTSPNPRQISMAAAPSITPSMSSKDLGVVLPCDHGLCLSCLQAFLLNATQNPQARFPTVCPQPGCRTPIPAESAEWVLDKEALEIWYRKLAEIHVANKVCCPLPECRSIVDLDDRDGTAVTCPECRNSFCASCAVPFHRGNRHKEGKQKKIEPCYNSSRTATGDTVPPVGL